MPSGLDHLRVVLVRARNPLNIGAAARAMSNFGVRRLRVVNPYEVAFQKARSAVGAAELLAKAEQFKSVAEAIADCALVVGTTSVGHRNLQQPLRRLEIGARLIRRQLASAPVAILFGSEKFGLSKSDLSHCHWLMRIPTRDEHDSMNLAQAVAICVYELVRTGKAVDGKQSKIHATAGDLERLTQLLLRDLGASGYVQAGSAAATEEKLRRMLRRLNLDERDAELWLGMLRQISWKLGSDAS
jgi:TrmH family RNA methyltransferase